MKVTMLAEEWIDETVGLVRCLKVWLEGETASINSPLKGCNQCLSTGDN